MYICIWGCIYTTIDQTEYEIRVVIGRCVGLIADICRNPPSEAIRQFRADEVNDMLENEKKFLSDYTSYRMISS